jgi:ribonucleoside-triphosphate reductase
MLQKFRPSIFPVQSLQKFSQLHKPVSTPFRLSSAFVELYKLQNPPFGFNGLGEFVYQTRYSRTMPCGGKEDWYQTVERVVNGTYNMQKSWIETNDLGWEPLRAQRSAQEMYSRIFQMKFLPPGRGLWASENSLLVRTVC